MPFKNKLRAKEYHKFWHLKNRNRILNKQRDYRYRLKIEVLEKYSNGEIKCQCCGEKIIEFLTIDHLNGGGTAHRRKIGRGNLYLWLKKNNFPEGYRVLCFNCNEAISIYGKCPHGGLKSE